MSENILIPNLPHLPGVYLMRDVAGKIIYIGKAKDLKKRVASYFAKSAPNREDASKILALVQVVRHVDYVPTASERDALVLERRLINRFQPHFNSMWKDDKSYPYVALTMGEDFPRLFLTREKKRGSKTIYFGPFPSVVRVRQLLRWTWRNQLFPLRPCKLEIREGELWSYEKVKSCLYLHTQQCPAPCLGKISSKKYKRIAKQAQWFFEGKKKRMIANWEKEMHRFSKKRDFEKAARIRDRLASVRHIQEKITFREMSENALQTRVKESRAIQELMTALSLPKPPQIMECFDISHIQGVDKVASMVRFKNGRPDKSQYRKFVIKTVKGSDDFKSMAEVVGRRYRRCKLESLPMPDLIIVDGGKGQLSSAVEALNEAEVKTVPIVALAKKEEEIFLPQKSTAVRLKKDSGGLLLMKFIRDEAHRFAVKFHRQRRGKHSLLQTD